MHARRFLDIHLSRFLNEPFTEPSHYPEIFERGIDPNVDDPSQIHAHSEVPTSPDDWPSLAEILAYRDRVRVRLDRVYRTQPMTRRLARTLSMVYEHEGLHAETLCYMLLQVSDRIRSPPGFATPDWTELGRRWNAQIAAEGVKARSAIVSYPAGTLDLGQDDDDSKDTATAYDSSHSFGWDNETPVRTARYDAFRIALLPVTNAEYADFLAGQPAEARDALTPASWLPTSDGKAFDVRVLPSPGRVAFAVARHWPVQGSGEQLAAYATSKGGRLPSEAELRRFYDDHPVDVPGRNLGFANWHPVPCVRPACSGTACRLTRDAQALAAVRPT
jgi:formylglycine-generating enzyme required for sulfatase activity